MSKLITMESRRGWTIFFDGMPVYGFPGEEDIVPLYYYEPAALRAVKRLKDVLEHNNISGKLSVEPTKLIGRTIPKPRKKKETTMEKGN